jgi:hypothetical protein
MSDAYTLLHDAYHLLDDPAHWTQGAGARDWTGETCEPEEDKAVMWCALGSLSRQMPEGILNPIYIQTVEAVAKHLPASNFHHSEWVSVATVATHNDKPGGYEAIRAAMRAALADLAPEPVEERERTLTPA